MPEYLVSNREEIPKYARIAPNGKSVAFVLMADATGYPTPEAASEAFERACSHMKSLSKTAMWHQSWAKASQAARARDYPLATRATLDDLLGVFETYYVRSEEGWLSRPQRKAMEGALTWEPSFSLAVPFGSEPAALAALARAYGHGGCVVKASCAFTGVSVPNPGAKKAPDPVRDAISAACEARDIAQSLKEDAEARLLAAKGPAEEPAKRAPRL